MTQAYPELGYFVLGGHIHDPRPAVDHFKLGEELGSRHGLVVRATGIKRYWRGCAVRPPALRQR